MASARLGEICSSLLFYLTLHGFCVLLNNIYIPPLCWRHSSVKASCIRSVYQGMMGNAGVGSTLGPGLLETHVLPSCGHE